jgi:hypothetical protein
MIVIGIFLIFSGSPLGVIFGVLLPAGGVALLIAGSRADQREAANVKSRAEAKASEVQHELQVTELESARDNKKLQKRLNEETNKTQVGQQVLAQQQIQVASKELDAKETFIEPAREMGVDVQGFIQTNIQKVINQIETDKVRQLNQAETDKQWTEIENWLKGANLVAQAQGQQRKQLTQDFIDTTLQIADTKKNRKLGEEAKQLIINRLEKNLQQIDGELDGLKTGGLIQAANETAARRLQEQVIELPGDYPEGVGPDDH